jgi:hypothetical protein
MQFERYSTQMPVAAQSRVDAGTSTAAAAAAGDDKRYCCVPLKALSACSVTCSQSCLQAVGVYVVVAAVVNCR